MPAHVRDEHVPRVLPFVWVFGREHWAGKKKFSKQNTATHWAVLLSGANDDTRCNTHCNTRHHTAAHTATYCTSLRQTGQYCGLAPTLIHIATHTATYTATHAATNTATHTGTHCNSLHFTAHCRRRMVPMLIHTATHTATHAATHTVTYTLTHCNSLHFTWQCRYMAPTCLWIKSWSRLSSHHFQSESRASSFSTLRCMLQHALQHTATHCNTLQHTATHCNTL